MACSASTARLGEYSHVLHSHTLLQTCPAPTSLCLAGNSGTTAPALCTPTRSYTRSCTRPGAGHAVPGRPESGGGLVPCGGRAQWERGGLPQGGGPHRVQDPARRVRQDAQGAVHAALAHARVARPWVRGVQGPSVSGTPHCLMAPYAIPLASIAAPVSLPARSCPQSQCPQAMGNESDVATVPLKLVR